LTLQIGEGRESRAPTRFSEVQRQRAGKAASPTGRANFSPSTSIRDVQELYRVITGDDVVSDKVHGDEKNKNKRY
jgi:hypothetical protein